MTLCEVRWVEFDPAVVGPGEKPGEFDFAAKCNHNGSFASENTMPTTLTLKNIPDEVYVRLKASAESHRRSMNSEAIVCLESILLPRRATAEEVIARARAIRDSLPKGKFSAKDIDAFKREGRP